MNIPWGRWGAQLTVALLRWMGSWSDAARHRLARAVSALAMPLARQRLHVARTNLRLCFPDWDEATREAMVREQMHLFVQAAVDRSLLWFAPLDVMAAHMRLVDEVHYTEARATGRPIILLSPHFVGIDAGGLRLSMDGEIGGMYARQSNPIFDKLLYEGRNRTGNSHAFERHEGVRKLLKLLKNRHPLYYLPDMDFGVKDSIFAEFFGIPAATLTALPKIAGMTQALIVPCITRLDREALSMGESRYLIQFYPAWHDYHALPDELAQVQFMNHFIEERITEDPAQYLWMHKRFKTRPEGEPNLYAQAQ